MTEPARVVHVVKGLEANSGVAVFVSELAREQAAAGTDVSVRASVGLSVATVATGSATGWTALSDATVTARCLFDESADGYREETFDSGARLMNMQFHFVPETDGRYDVRLQMRIAGGYAVIAQGGAALEVAGANYAPDI